MSHSCLLPLGIGGLQAEGITQTVQVLDHPSWTASPASPHPQWAHSSFQIKWRHDWAFTGSVRNIWRFCYRNGNIKWLHFKLRWSFAHPYLSQACQWAMLTCEHKLGYLFHLRFRLFEAVNVHYEYEMHCWAAGMSTSGFLGNVMMSNGKNFDLCILLA